MQSYLDKKDSYLVGKNIVLALSGGIDSIVLLHYLNKNYHNNLKVIHCNHNLSKHCDKWSLFCKDLCKNINVEYKNINISITGKSNIEQRLRQKRYQALACNLKDNDILCTAHHQNDQAETLLIQLFRGGGLNGLAAMPKIKKLGKGFHYRPLLDVKKEVINNYANLNKLKWVEDDSNENINFRRNFIRLKIIPELFKVYENITQVIARAANNQAEALQLVNELALIDITQNKLINNNKINIANLIKLDLKRIKNVIRYHIKSLDFIMPTNNVMLEIVKILYAKKDAKPKVNWDNYQVRSYKNELYFINNNDENNNFCPLYQEFVNLANFSIGYRTKGQRVRLINKKHTQSLKKILQQANIPPWERDNLKMYYIDNKLVAMERIGRLEEV
jgi:tRNA(Ile)-lysidine synthase